MMTATTDGVKAASPRAAGTEGTGAATRAAAWDTDQLAAFNLAEAERELRRIRIAIEQGTLRALAERRALTSPHTLAILRRLDREHAHMEAATGVFRSSPLQCNTWESLHGAEVERFRRRVRDRYRPPALADVLVLLPCSATKPYRFSPSHRFFARALDDSGIRHRVHEVMVTSPLGLVPRELEQTSPARDYDIPVTGRWTRDEEAIIRGQLAHLLMAGDYQHVVAHVPESTYTFLRDLLPEDTVHTAHTDHPQRKKECDRLRDALRAIRSADPKPADRRLWNERKRQDAAALAAWQFGPDAAEALVADATAVGRAPYVKLMRGAGRDAAQLAMVTDRGLLSLTLDGADRIASAGAYRVTIGDFPLAATGSLFAPGIVAADAEIRPGDSVAVMQDGRVVATGQAQMGADEMVASKRGVAVVMKHVRVDAQPAKPTREAEVTA
jgi:archaeosine synthase